MCHSVYKEGPDPSLCMPVIFLRFRLWIISIRTVDLGRLESAMVLVYHHCGFGAQLVPTGCKGRCLHVFLSVSRLHMWVGLLHV